MFEEVSLNPPSDKEWGDPAPLPDEEVYEPDIPDEFLGLLDPDKDTEQRDDIYDYLLADDL